MTTPTDVDRTAPVVVQHEIDVRARPRVVWELHTAVDAWPSWNPAITAAQLDAPFRPGSSFTWTSYGFPVTSTIYEVQDGSRVLWGGTADGITGIHEWRFNETPGGVNVVTSESFAGPLVDGDPESFRGMLDASLVAWLADLKAAAEAR
jgi:Polyketide cyclase / dehydrase and lipid transport